MSVSTTGLGRPEPMLVLRPWASPELTSWGRLPMHPIPHAEAGGAPRIALDGVWSFELFHSPEAALTATGPLRTQVTVPGCWTMQEFDDVHDVRDRPHYTNVQMPFPDPPPHPPARNPTGVYEREVELPAAWLQRRVVLHVGAAESVLLVRVNGADVGISKDSHLAAEFDITPVLRAERNVLRLTVVKYSDASFLEDQDQWWHGGITRPVFMYATGPVYLANVQIRAGLAGGISVDGTATGRLEVLAEVGSVDPLPAGWRVQLDASGLDTPVVQPARPFGQVDVPGAAGRVGPAEGLRLSGLQQRHAAGIPLSAADRAEVSALEATRRGLGIGEALLRAEIPTVRAWSAEQPRLYGVTLSLVDPAGAVAERATFRVGYRSVNVTGADLLVNGRRVMVRGVNRHDVDARTGRVASVAAIRADLAIMKQYGFNAVRTSHYPNRVELLDACDELGLYVIDEADIETHAYAHDLCDEPRYLGAWLDRVSRMVRRDAHHPCVVAWSMGNESGYGANHDAAAGWVRRYDPTRPLHYEGAITFDWASDQTASDVTCPMYPPIDAIVAHAHSGLQRHPLIMCEYSHAMGNSNGTLAEYWAAIESTPGLQGGFVWEFVDHGLLQRLPDGRQRWAYGGDFGDEPNDGTFVLDGMLFPDRTPKPAIAEHRQLAAPVRLIETAEGFVVENRQLERDLSWLRVGAARCVVGQHIEPLQVALPDVAAGQRAPLDVRPQYGTAGEVWLVLELETAHDQTWAPAGTPIGHAQLQLRAENRALLDRAAARPTGCPVTLDDDGLLRHGLLAAPPTLALWRAPTDNDRIGGVAEQWRQWGLASLSRTVLDVATLDDWTVVHAVYRTGCGLEVRHELRATSLRTDDGGGLLIEESAVIPAGLVDLPRVGTTFEVVAGLDRVRWLGPGPWESYPDRCAAGAFGWHEFTVDALRTPYIRPQENGGRHGVRRFTVFGGERRVGVVLDEPRQVSWSHYRAVDLDAATHDNELVGRPETIVHIDAAHRGLGTASCGPDTLPQYLVGPGTYNWSWVLLA